MVDNSKNVRLNRNPVKNILVKIKYVNSYFYVAVASKVWIFHVKIILLSVT